MRGMNIKRRTTIALISIIVLGGLLALDLAFRGMAWRFAWSVTGREEPISQIRGVLEWAVSYTRPQPRTDPLTPIRHSGEIPYGINTFLQLEPDPQKVEDQVRMISEAGFVWLRQQFPWEDIEIDGRGDFEDRRNIEAVGILDAWAKYDRIVDLADEYGLRIQARLDNPPDWARADPDAGGFAPPDDFDDFVNFAVAVAERYRGRITHYQIWNEPNIYPEWGEQAVDPEAYTDLLCRTYDAIKAVDPDNVVISGALAPTIALTGRDLNDFIYLQRMYDAGAGDCFDVLSVQGYGLFSGPTDRRMRPTTINIARNLYIRDMMIANGDADKAIWISEAAWNFVPDADEVPDIANRTAYGQVTPEQAADYAPMLFDRAEREWPWVGVINYWFFTRPDDSWANRPEYYFRMVEPYYDPAADPPFPPLPVWDSLRDYMQNHTPALHQGIHEAGHWAVTHQIDEIIADDEATFGEALRTTGATFTARGTDVMLRWRAGDADSVRVTVDGEARELDAAGADWARVTIHASTLPETVTITLEAAGGDLLLDTITVLDRTYQNAFGYALVAFTGGLMLLIAVITGIRGRRDD